MFNKILIANRGEIACRVIKTAREMGIATVAVYSDADSQALHVHMADEAIHIGPSPARDSYLLAERILDAAVTTNADAIHPGYGFLSENAGFAQACAEAGVVFIGPPTAAIEAMGSKSAAKRIMEQAGVPLVPGYHGDDQDPAILKQSADNMGYPVLLKATAGGGGKGMRQVWSADEFDEALAAAMREAMAGFGDDNMLVEKYLTKPRHVELQVFCDNHGNGVYLAERDCSVQRRHQKVIEEAPAPGMTEALRQRMGDAAVTAARAIDYRGAGTVEFLLDEDGSFYFMEMNTRLQVEHPVTEMITGQDLVRWQLLVASGAPLPLTQEQVRINGHAFEARVYAEDPDNDFLPATGTLGYLQPPAESRHVRVDTGVRQGDEISVYYDPMIAKLIVWDENRERALQRLASALAEYRIGGTVTNLEFLYNLSTSRPFVEAELDTGFIEKHSDLIFHDRHQDLAQELPLAALALLLNKQQNAAAPANSDSSSPWNDSSGWRMNEPHVHRLTVHCHQADHSVEVEQRGDLYLVRAADKDTPLRGELQGEQLLIDREGHRLRATLAQTHDGFTLYMSDGACHFHEVPPDTGEADGSGTDGGLDAPMNGTIVELLVEPNAQVNTGDALLVMEAMKMEQTIRAPADGTVDSFYYQPGDLVDGGAELLAFTAAED
ncbi:3-methylcrotonyl-CoA carboxylase [Halioglobus japonicus]|uniref:Biotin carboxylase n=1 Tax=Halioglobus japonicus TaxID=930805 RepID=A0AAP8MBE9_9GAMM|nr:acetyl/propionyl/methylcrotonyl-CoA carboxylase subunit alpha [Halioglobus japonicus]AQA20043.1 3-methylcrotonyl-CoA carboxylase [Halioglobus japonicus]PLW84698.1 acetyl/propionyl/methylcrotonyl-CoA carboxylase subunit alpha [Halioglobus japonicus]GHD20964.1 3-methylcrotonyl-CoA carboxylase subunit alpha [Halioglobus japonicus]